GEKSQGIDGMAEGKPCPGCAGSKWFRRSTAPLWHRIATHRRCKLAIRTLSRRCSGAAGRGRRTRRCDVPFARQFIGHGAERPAASLRRHRRLPFGLRAGHPDGGRGGISAVAHFSLGRAVRAERDAQKRDRQSSMPPPPLPWPIRRCVGSLQTSGRRLCHASSRRGKLSPRFKKPTSRSGGRLSKRRTSKRNDSCSLPPLDAVLSPRSHRVFLRSKRFAPLVF